METESLAVTEQKKVSHIDIIGEALTNPYKSVRSLVKNDLYYFVQYFWSEYSQDEFQPNWHIECICKRFEKVARRVAEKKPKEKDLIFNVPPGSTKTAVLSVMAPLWCWVNWYWMKFITASYTSDLALESAEYSRDIMRSEKFKMLFPELDIKQDKDTKSNFRVIKKQYVSKGRVPRILIGGNRFSTSVSGTATGYHAHIIIWDDLIDPNRAISKAEIKKANHFVDNVLPFRKTDKKVTVTVGIMQRLAQDDPTGHLLRTRPESIEHICLPGEIRNYREKVKPPELIKYYSEDGLMDVNRLDWEVLDELLKLGQYTYGGQVGQDPIPLGGGMFKVDNFAMIETVPIAIRVSQTVRYWDKAGTAGGGAYTAGVKMCRLKDGKFVVLDVKRGQWSSEERERIIRQTAEADGQGVKVWVEQEPGSGGLESADATVRNLSGFSVEKDHPRGDKALRADPYSVQVNGGNVQLLNGVWNKDYIDELQNFPNSIFKDQADASSGAFSKITSLKRVEVIRKKRR